MTYKTCKILTRLKTASHVSVARRMEPFAKHLLNLASWLEQLYPSQVSVSALLPAVWGWWKLAVFRKTLLCHGALPLLCLLSLPQQHCMQAQLSGQLQPSRAQRGWSRAELQRTHPEHLRLASTLLWEQQPLRTVREVTGSKFAYLCTVWAIKHFPLDSL